MKLIVGRWYDVTTPGSATFEIEVLRDEGDGWYTVTTPDYHYGEQNVGEPGSPYQFNLNHAVSIAERKKP